MIKIDTYRLRLGLTAAATLVLALHLRSVHNWFAEPFAVWVGWDEAYISAFSQRMLQGHWLPYVDAVSHRGPLLYWIAAIFQKLGQAGSFLPMRHASLLMAEACVALLFGLGTLMRRPLAGFVAAAVFVYVTSFAMSPIDGIGFNGELAATPFAIASVLLGLLVLNRKDSSLPSSVWLYAGSGVLGSLAGLCKQISILHLLPTALFIGLVAWREHKSQKTIDFRPGIAFATGAVTPLLAVIVFFARAGHLKALFYYFFTYNKAVYLGPVTLGVAIEQSYIFLRSRSDLALALVFLTIWGAIRFIVWLRAQNDSEQDRYISVFWLNLLLALLGAFASFRFWNHYLITVLPWIGLLAGLWLEEVLERPKNKLSLRTRNLLYAACALTFLLINVASFRITRLLLEGERRAGAWGDPKVEPINNYIVEKTKTTDRIFVWGFAPEYYTSAGRSAASRYVYTTFVSGLVPWFENLTLEQEDGYAVPGSRETLLRELTKNVPELILDVPSSLRGRSLKRYKFLADFVNERYCVEAKVKGRNGRTAEFYRRRHNSEPCKEPTE